VHAALLALAVPAGRTTPTEPRTVAARFHEVVPAPEAQDGTEAPPEGEPIEFEDVVATPAAEEPPPAEEPTVPEEPPGGEASPGAPSFLIAVPAGALRSRPRPGPAPGPGAATAAAPAVPAAAAHPAAAAPAPSGVHRRAVPHRTNRRPDYPLSARAAGIVGTVVLRMHVDAEGHVTRVEVESSSGDALLDAAAERAALAWRFEPALRDGAPVATVVRQRVRFHLDDRRS
jgi:protein TonB